MSGSPLSDPFEQARTVADAVLYEGYLLYPYRADAAKNQLRWQFGVLVPPSYASDAHGEYATCQTQLLAEPGPDAVLRWRLRFLHAVTRTVEAATPDGWAPRESAEHDGVLHLTFDETAEESVDVAVPLWPLADAPDDVTPFAVPGAEQIEQLSPDLRLRRVRRPLQGVLRLRVERLPGPYRVLRLTCAVENRTETRSCASGAAGATPDAQDLDRQRGDRPQALRSSLIAAHSVFALSAGGFVSALDPPEWAKAAVRDCRNVRTWPVLLGEPGRTDAVLSAPVILYDHPVVAPESPGETFDSLEIDELLVLRTLTLTDAEKRQVRATDARADALLGRAETLPPELFERLHGAIRQLRPVGVAADPFRTTAPWWDPGADAGVDPATDTVVVDGVAVGAGCKVRLRPGGRRTDAQDMFLVDRVATVHAVLLDVDGSTHLAVTVDDDPAADLQVEQGRFRYFAPEEVAPA
ncbi:hypothetical protein Cs7R123_18330 [Catellatospora sp. TT07R-123]|uniref:hypothetical protein n=1 Tax=Catellatospora sp. TT07R-123 TaxID=2733863 RepID=UPI001B003A3C|nr:hypothetical protein [Catellatospora sp. TT07R-123]GHJ44491.1 hypothetical protein Cs7R123_18330 [Catellatospora sp. TT07R-123]